MISVLPDLDDPFTNVNRPLFSIITPIFDNSDLISHNLSSLVQQREPRWEGIYGFDGENEGMELEFSDDFPDETRFRLIKGDKPATIGDLFNRCLDAARGEYIVILHAEDSLDYGALEKLAYARVIDPELEFGYILDRIDDDSCNDVHRQIPHRLIPELDEIFYPASTNYILYKLSTLRRYNLRFESTNDPQLHERFSNAYLECVGDVGFELDTITSYFDLFTFPKAMLQAGNCD